MGVYPGRGPALISRADMIILPPNAPSVHPRSQRVFQFIVVREAQWQVSYFLSLLLILRQDMSP